MKKYFNYRFVFFFAAILVTLTSMAQTRMYNYSYNLSNDGMKVKASPCSPGLRCITFTSGNSRFYLSNENGYSGPSPNIYNRVESSDGSVLYQKDLSNTVARNAASIWNQVNDQNHGYHETGQVLIKDDFSVMMVILSNGTAEIWFLE